MNVMIPPTKAGFETEPIEVGHGREGVFGHKLPVTLQGMGTFASNTIDLEYYDGFQWVTYKRANATVQLAAANTVVVIDYPLRFRLKKLASTNELGVMLSSIDGQQYVQPGYEGVFVFEDGNHLVAEDDGTLDGKNIKQNNER